MPCDNMRVVNQVNVAELRRIAAGDAAYCFFDDTTSKGNAVRRKQLVDALTAKAIVVCYDALSAQNKPKFERMAAGNLAQFMRLVDFCWKHVKL